MAMELNDQQREAKTQYEQRKERVARLTELTLQSTDGTMFRPTPTQEENDLFALGLLDPDDKVPPPQDRVMPSVAAQRAYLESGEALPQAQARPAAPAAPRQPAPPPRQPEPSPARS